MTTRRNFAAPVLDRLLQREVETSIEVPATMAYAFNSLYEGGGDNLDDGTWLRRSDTELGIGLADSDGVDFPTDLILPATGVMVSWDGAAASILTITALVIVRVGFSNQPVSLRITFGSTLPSAGTSLSLTVTTGGTKTTTQTVTRSVWCARHDFSARDQLNIAPGQFFELSDRRFVVRFEGPSWDVGDTFTFEGESYTVRGVSQLGRSRHLELLARVAG